MSKTKIKKTAIVLRFTDLELEIIRKSVAKHNLEHSGNAPLTVPQYLTNMINTHMSPAKEQERSPADALDELITIAEN